MPTYADLISDLADENGGLLPDNITYLIREVERELWQELFIYAPEVSYTVTIPAGSNTGDLSTLNYVRWLHIRSVLGSGGSLLRRVPYNVFEILNSQSSTPELYAFSWNPGSSTLYVTRAPSLSATVKATVLEREPFIQDGDSEQNRFFLGDGYNVLKYGVLYKRVTNPEKLELWKSRFLEAFQSAVLALKSRKRVSLLGQAPLLPGGSEGRASE